ncbi:MAG: hypothetical protein J5667_04095 [Bacteroidales bacterium]|nr:hypothetical protein [Bacteroidales bacterium]
MESKQYYHFCAHGAETRNFIICERDYRANFNLMGVCAANSDAEVVSYSFEDTHPHGLLWGTKQACLDFMKLYENQSRHYAAKTHPKGMPFSLHCELYPIGDDLDYLLNVAVYTIIQPTKDGKPVMYYDYRWGTGSMYFRNKYSTPVWHHDDQSIIHTPIRFGELGTRDRREIVHSRILTIPDNWLICNGLILPYNYIDTSRFESIYKTHNRFRVFSSSPKQREEELLRKMAEYRGISMDDLEARTICGNVCKQLFGFRDARRLDAPRRITLAQQLRRSYRLSFRQLATLVYLPENELRRYIK